MAEALTYASPTILERRRRILREARKILVEKGLEGFSVRTLCRRAEIAQRTLYNAFESKENVIAAAIHGYQVDFSTRLALYETDGLSGLLRLILTVNVRNLQIRNYIRAVMAIYFSPTADPKIRTAIHRLGMPVAWLAKVGKAGLLRPGVDAVELASLMATTQYGTLNAWARDEIEDARFLAQMIGGVLLLGHGACTGAARSEIDVYLDDLYGAREIFQEMLARAENSVPQSRRGGASA